MDRDSCDIIIFALWRHDSFITSSAMGLAREFAKRNRVFYIDHPYSAKDLITEAGTPPWKNRIKTLFTRSNKYRKMAGMPENLTVVIPGLTLPINSLPEGKLYNMLADVNDAIFFQCIKSIIRDFKVRDFVYFNAYDPYFGARFPKTVKPVKTVYLSLDDLSQVPYTAKHGIRAEQEMMRHYDLTLASSRELYRLKQPFARRIHYFPNAADTINFSRALEAGIERPAELRDLNRPLIGYTGNIDERPDYALLREIADHHRDKYLIMVGPINTEEHIKHGLDTCDNVIFTGPKKVHELPAYLKFFDCTIIPFKCNVLTKSIYPLKINEYLAAGKPVVATNFSEDIGGFAHVAYVAQSYQEFVIMINQAMQENSVEKQTARLAMAAGNTWHNRVEEFWRAIAV
jgi:glycosyltransferase involved in cell wall biosynthesis